MSYLETTKYTLDWLQGVLPFSNVRQLFRALGEIDDRLKYENWSVFGNLRNYRTRFICQGKASVSIAYNDDPFQDPYNKNLWHSSELNDDVSLIAEDHPFNPGIFVSISGDGLRWLNAVSGTVDKIIKYFRLQGFNCSRLDLACDVFDPNNDLVPTVLKAFKNAVAKRPNRLTLRSNIRRTSGKNGSVKLFPYTDDIRYPDDPKQIWNVTFGNHGSSFGMFRCYDKWFEIASGRLNSYSSEMLKDLPHQYWYRLEYEIHNGKMKKYAASLFNALADGQVNVQTGFGWCAENMFDIVKLKDAHQNISYSLVSDAWSQFIAYTIHFVQLGLDLVSTPWVEKTPEKFRSFIRHVSKMCYKIQKLFDADPQFRDEVLEIGQQKYDHDIICSSEFESYLSMIRTT